MFKLLLDIFLSLRSARFLVGIFEFFAGDTMLHIGVTSPTTAASFCWANASFGNLLTVIRNEPKFRHRDIQRICQQYIHRPQGNH